jgi:hypothetical protein
MTTTTIRERIDRVKHAVPLLRYLEGLAFQLKRVKEGQWQTLCPFHSEKTPSFHIFEKDHHYHCYGCGAHGDIVDFVEATKGCSKVEALQMLEQDAPGLRFLNAAPPPKPEPEAPLLPLKESRYQAWLIACEKLAADDAALKRLAAWRGFSPETFRGAARAGLMALWRYWDQPREALLVLAPRTFFAGLPSELPESPAPALLPHAFHCRLSPETPGNPHKKQSWRYDPAGSKAWPFLWGNPFGARWIFILEGQWDALALADLCGWHSPDTMPPQTVILGLRGATSWRLLLHKDHGLPIDPEAAAICIGDADAAGAKWYEPDGFLATLRPRVKKLLTFRPTTPGCKDFNDLTQGGHITAADFLTWVKQRLKSHPWKRPGPPLTFGAWCKAAAIREDELGRAARLVATDPTRPKGRKAPKHWRSYWRAQKHLSEPDLLLLYRLLDTWKTRADPATATLAE